MRVLWFPGNGANYASDNKYNGGGWTGALAKALLDTHPEIELGMVIPWDRYMTDFKGNVKVYGVPNIKHAFWGYSRKLQKQVSCYKRVVEDFDPDVIHVFGTEHIGGMVATITNKPVVIHLQGILNFLKESWLPQNMSWGKYILWNPRQWFAKTSLLRACETERVIFMSCRNFMGRTEMDKRVSRLLSPSSHYFYCGEMLRPDIFFSDILWSFHERKHHVLVSVISVPLYKGGDVLLRTAKILKEMLNFDFEWKVYGINDLSECERLSNIKANDVNVIPCGVINAEQLVGVIADSDVFIHPSYIENSPNTVCEAQLLGIPVIANYVGGIPSLISHLEDGVLVPPSDCYNAASYISELATDKDFAVRLGKNGRIKAMARHNPESIVVDVVNVYEQIMTHHN